MICIILNIVTMAMAYETSTKEYDAIIKDINMVFTFVASLSFGDVMIFVVCVDIRSYIVSHVSLMMLSVSTNTQVRS